jgi:hypothetical protein
MTTTEPVQDEGARRYVKAAWQAVVHWGVRVGFAVVVIIVILAQLHIFKEQDYLLLVISGVILLLSEQLQGYDRQMREQSTAIKNIVESESLRLYALHDCVKDVDETLPSIGPREKVVIEHLGLNLAQAWQYFEPFLRTHPNLTDIDYRLLVLTDETGKIAGADEEVRGWSANTSQILDRIKRDVNAIIDEFGDAKKIQFEVRKYWAIPVIHGFRIVSPTSRCYMAICRALATTRGHGRYDHGPVCRRPCATNALTKEGAVLCKRWR